MQKLYFHLKTDNIFLFAFTSIFSSIVKHISVTGKFFNQFTNAEMYFRLPKAYRSEITYPFHFIALVSNKIFVDTLCPFLGLKNNWDVLSLARLSHMWSKVWVSCEHEPHNVTLCHSSTYKSKGTSKAQKRVISSIMQVSATFVSSSAWIQQKIKKTILKLKV